MKLFRYPANSIKRLLILILITVLFTTVLLFFNFHFLVKLIPYADHDFMSFWAGDRAMLEGVDPYNPGNWTSLFNRYGSNWISNPRSLYPIWTAVLFMPLALLPVDYAASVWLTLSELILGMCIFLLINYDECNESGRLGLLVLLSGSFLFRGTVSTLTSGQITFVLVLVITLFLFLMKRGHPFLAGLVFALILLKPNPFILFGPAMGTWFLVKRYWQTIAGSLSGVAGLLLVRVDSRSRLDCQMAQRAGKDYSNLSNIHGVGIGV
jgi:hypothetical protein